MNDISVTLADCVIAYKKAKAEAFYENTHFHALAFAAYEKHLIRNLQRLLATLQADGAIWSRNLQWIGGFAYVPKSVEPPDTDSERSIYFRYLDPVEEWERAFKSGGEKRTKADFRLVITPTVDFQVVSALWIIKVGHKFDSVVNQSLSYGNRLRRQPREPQWSIPGAIPGGINLDCTGLFAPYFSAYRRWRENGLKAISVALKAGQRVLAVTMCEPALNIDQGF